jgi:hypothetical protein
MVPRQTGKKAGRSSESPSPPPPHADSHPGRPPHAPHTHRKQAHGQLPAVALLEGPQQRQQRRVGPQHRHHHAELSGAEGGQRPGGQAGAHRGGQRQHEEHHQVHVLEPGVGDRTERDARCSGGQGKVQEAGRGVKGDRVRYKGYRETRCDEQGAVGGKVRKAASGRGDGRASRSGSSCRGRHAGEEEVGKGTHG